MPIMQYRRQEITGCCCSEGEIIAQMKVNKSGFVPGEPIVVEMDINNKSETPVQAWTVELIQVRQCLSKNEKRNYFYFILSSWMIFHNINRLNQSLSITFCMQAVTILLTIQLYLCIFKSKMKVTVNLYMM